MTTKVKPKADLYIPRPTEWNWDTLSDAEIARRLDAAKATQAKIIDWSAELTQARDERWKTLRGRLSEAKLFETQAEMAKIEDAGKQLKQLGRLLTQANAAIKYIEEA